MGVVARPVLLQQFIDAMRDAIADGLQRDSATDSYLLDRPRVTDAAQRIFSALQARQLPANTQVTPQRQSACSHLQAALSVVAGSAQAGPAAIRLASAFTALEPQLAWYHRPGAEQIGEPFASGHANTTIVGNGGLEQRDDVWIGVSLIAPDVRYPDHRHPPEEVYVVLSPGQWRQDEQPWQEPGPGGIVYNPPGVVHAMRPTSGPLLAVWCLWRDS